MGQDKCSEPCPIPLANTSNSTQNGDRPKEQICMHVQRETWCFLQFLGLNYTQNNSLRTKLLSLP